MKKQTLAQVKVLKKMNDENLYIRKNTSWYETADFYDGKLHNNPVNLSTFNTLLDNGLIVHFIHENTDTRNHFFKITDLGKQAINEA